MKTVFGDYFLGLDIGTDSVGWAVTDPSYNILEFNRKDMWGIHLFDSGKTAAERRTRRCARRRLQRRNHRIKLLRELFSEEIAKVDQAFFERLDESDLFSDDKKVQQRNSLFNDENFNDKDYHQKFPTIYHLRKHLIETDTRPDIRLVYLALHHIIKHRGHFLFKNLQGEIPDFLPLLEEFTIHLDSEYDIKLDISDDESIRDVLLDVRIGVKEKTKRLSALMGVDTPEEKEIVKLIAGRSPNYAKLFSDESLKEIEFSFKDGNLDEKLLEHEDAFGEGRLQTIMFAKQVYDWSILSKILGDHKYISEAKIELYEQHKHDLAILKKTILQHKPEIFQKVFKALDEKGNYCSYVGFSGKSKPKNRCNQDEFCKYIIKSLEDLKDIESDETRDMMERLENGSFMPKQKDKANSVLPYALHQKELKDILHNMSNHYPFLLSKDEDGISVMEKIVLIHEFRIPYYVGPLDTRSDRSWLIRKSMEPITPWNFESIVDLDRTSEEFINKLTSTCTYLAGEKVLPKNSLLYSRFMLYNELNTLSVNGERIKPSVKNEMIEDLFIKPDKVKKVTKKRIFDYLRSRGYIDVFDVLDGIDDVVKSNLKSEITIRNIIHEKISNTKMVEEVIRLITIFGDEQSRLRTLLKRRFSDQLSDDEINQLMKLRFSGWGRLSEKLLTGINDIDPSTGNPSNIMTLLKETNQNLNQILERKSIKTQIEEHNANLTSRFDKISYEMVDGLYVSPAVKRGIWRALQIVEDIVKVTGKPPKKIFVETTRESREKKRTVSRKDSLTQLMKSCEEYDCSQLLDKLNTHQESDLKNRNLYLYYTQLGKCMYCGEKLNIENIKNTELMNRDHIYPRSKTKDDSIHNNLVLVCQSCNQRKGDSYPLPPEWQSQMKPFWKYLRDKKLINNEKYGRLVRTTGFSDEDLYGFINRQLVETSQSVKAVIEVLKHVYKTDTDVVYVKGGRVSEFRQEFGPRNEENGNGNEYLGLTADERLPFAKCRLVNDYHHAKDAYLNIVVGNVHDVKFTKDFKKFVKRKEQYNMANLYRYEVSRNGNVAWIPGESGSISVIKKHMRRNDILFTTYPHERKGKFFDDNPLPANENLINRKMNLDSKRYGGYNSQKNSFYSLIEYESKGKTIRQFEGVPIRIADKAFDETKFIEYLENELGFQNPRLLIPKIKMNCMLEINGYRCIITGGDETRIGLNNAVQLVLSYEEYLYCKRIEKYIEARKEKRGLPPSSFRISVNENVKLFETLFQKCNAKPFNVKFGTLSTRLDELRDVFIQSSLENQTSALFEILSHFQCNGKLANLKDIKGKQLGKIRHNKKVNSKEKYKIAIINQSPSGLFENRTEI